MKNFFLILVIVGSIVCGTGGCASKKKAAWSTQTFQEPIARIQVVSGAAAIIVSPSAEGEEALVSVRKKMRGRPFGNGTCQSELRSVGDTLSVIMISDSSDCRQAAYIRVPKTTFVSIQGTSGAITVTGFASQKVDIENTSGSVAFSGEAPPNDKSQSLKIGSTSGSIDVQLRSVAPQGAIHLKSTSGHISFSAPKDCAFALTRKTHSGYFRGDHSKFSTDSQRVLNIQTNSGNISLKSL